MRNTLIGLIAFCAMTLIVPSFIPYGGMLMSESKRHAVGRTIPEIDVSVPVTLEVATFGMG